MIPEKPWFVYRQALNLRSKLNDNTIFPPRMKDVCLILLDCFHIKGAILSNPLTGSQEKKLEL